MTILQFVPFDSSIDPTFWHTLTKLKIDVLKLKDQPIPIVGWYERGRWVKDKINPDTQIGIGNQVRFDSNSFSIFKEDQNLQVESKDLIKFPGRVMLCGSLKNFNTIEEFKSCDKQSLFNSFSNELWENSITNSNFNLNRSSPQFFVITFADLKKYKYYYWFAFPAFIPKPSWIITPSSESQTFRTLEINHAIELSNLIHLSNHHHWIAKQHQGHWLLSSISQWLVFFESVPDDNKYLIFIDPAAHPQALGWPLRNLLASVNSIWGLEVTKFNVIAYRDPVGENLSFTTSQSLVVTIELPEQISLERPSAVGWEKNAAGKLGPRIADLAPMMDPTRLAEQAVDLNLKLMRWRILPDLNLEKISSTRCLLLGAGTLGCYVSRTLLAWGVRKITFVDSAKVSFSNPVRQPLFEFQDCLDGGKPKAACAAASLKRIYPGIDVEGIELSIPMPGHPIAENLIDHAKQDVERLEKLFDEHDVIYLLMDSRESRWLPTLLGASKRKLVINAALGFDSYLVMRHGVRSSCPPESSPVQCTSSLPQIRQLGCYFCNDVVAPADSLTDRTLDQMCTVTRPGLAPIASATAVEIMTAVLQHPDGIEALAEIGDDSRPAESRESILGVVPHQIRGFLSKFENMKLAGPAYDKCTACSETVIEEYEAKRFEMLLRVFNDRKYLESLTGLDKLYDASEAIMESVEWDEKDEEDL
ncbi:hypothetical protein O181_027987 [Austropuccinia psidii MF-1]|uniref:Ubiquitin-like modifier-activating enzyme ATG7 n=1 Tax=Austropuccinia psidii MF-1 TaxID=1389203 RepID=A0A9Q3CR05_9BASI|nr:hypothetical protein [Austropuccinia psidii MF-1]